jgi:kynureninase
VTLAAPKRDAADPLLAYRARFPILSRANYLISNSLGAVPQDVAGSLQEYYERWATRGVYAARPKSERQVAHLIALAQRRGWRCTTPRDPARRGGTVAIDVLHGYEVSRALKAREIICDYRPGAGVRLSLHFYTRDDELDAAIDAIDDILRSGAWRPFGDHRTTVT